MESTCSRDHGENVDVVQLVRVTVEQIVVCQHHRSIRKSGDDSACASHCGADRGVPVPQIMSKSGGDSACAQHRGADRGVPVPQILPKVEVIQLVRTLEQIVVYQCHRSCRKCGGGSACAFRCGTDRGQPVPEIMGINGEVISIVS